MSKFEVFLELLSNNRKLVVVSQFRDSDEPTISHFELDGNTVVIQMDAVSSDS